MKPFIAYVVFIDGNYYDLWRCRRDAIDMIETITQEPWATAKSHCAAVKCLVSPTAEKPRG